MSFFRDTIKYKIRNGFPSKKVKINCGIEQVEEFTGRGRGYVYVVLRTFPAFDGLMRVAKSDALGVCYELFMNGKEEGDTLDTFPHLQIPVHENLRDRIVIVNVLLLQACMTSVLLLTKQKTHTILYGFLPAF